MTMTISPARTTDAAVPPAVRGRRRRRAAIVLTATTAALLLGTGTALAHVAIVTGPAAPGSYASVGFRVPNESDSAATTKVEIQLPTDTPLASVSAQQAPGWTIATTETTFPAPITVGDFTIDKATTTVTFTADGAGLAPHEFTVFTLMVGPIPDVESLTFAAVQTYDDGEVVSWNQPTPASGEEPEHPAPVLTISGAAAAGDDDDGGMAMTTGSTDATSAEPATAGSISAGTTTASNTDTTARVLGIAGIVLGLAGVATGVILARARRRTGSADGGGTA